jgi:signal transduction histidine kinase/CheY-like chemotaxis protein
MEASMPYQADTGRALRDLMSLLALPALWLGKDGETVLRLMAQSLDHLVPLRFSYVEATLLPGGEARVFGRAAGAPLPTETLPDWRAAAATWPTSANRAAVLRGEQEVTPLGPMRVLRLELGVGPVGGGVWFGSDAPDFASDVDLALLRAAASLAATGLQAAAMRHERDEADRAKDEFLAMLGHELRNPLAPIRAAAGIWQRDGIGPEQIRQTGAIVERQVQHMTRLVDDLLDVSRLSTGVIELDVERIDLRDVARVAVEQSRPYLDGKGHSLALDIPDDTPCTVDGDRERLVQILSNLLHNAAKYTPPGGRIALSMVRLGATINLVVSDNGIGIEPAMLTRIFDLFTQVRRPTDRSNGGLGVGLALARRLVGLHGGVISADSDGVGQGTRMAVILPAASALPDAPDARQGGDFGSFADADVDAGADMDAPAMLRVLVVDDNRDAGDTMGMLLEALGHEVAVVDHPFQALERAAGFAPHVYLLDIGLPGIDGYELARRLRGRDDLGAFTLIALTGYGQAADQQHARAAGFDFHCTKPVDIDVLSAMLAQVAAARAAGAQAALGQ